MSELHPILFIDFDGTLCHDRYWRSLPPELFSIVQEKLFKDRDSLVVVNEWMLGKRTAEDINAMLAKELGVHPSDLWELFVYDCENMRVDEGVLQTINALRDRYTTVLATTNMDSFTRFTVPALSLEKYFDKILNSADLGLLKSDETGAFFKTLVGLESLEGCVLIDDSERVCTIFESLGGRSLRITKDSDIKARLAEISREGE